VLLIATFISMFLNNKYSGDPEKKADMKNLFDRTISWWYMIALLGTVFWLGKYVVTVMFGLVSFFALREFMTLTATRQSDYRSLVLSFYVILPLQYWLVWTNWYGLFSIMIPVYAFLILPIMSTVEGDTEGFLERAAKIQWGIMISVFCISHLPALLFLEFNDSTSTPLSLLIYLILVVQLSDVLQYVCGKLFGKHKVAPKLSPSKTTEGLVGGVLAASVIGMFLYPLTPFNMLESFGMSLLICLMGFLGGLVMSAIKRDQGVKDWGYMINGHGGVLDRTDSLCFAAPVFFHFVRYFFT